MVSQSEPQEAEVLQQAAIYELAVGYRTFLMEHGVRWVYGPELLKAACAASFNQPHFADLDESDLPPEAHAEIHEMELVISVAASVIRKQRAERRIASTFELMEVVEKFYADIMSRLIEADRWHAPWTTLIRQEFADCMLGDEEPAETAEPSSAADPGTGSLLGHAMAIARRIEFDLFCYGYPVAEEHSVIFGLLAGLLVPGVVVFPFHQKLEAHAAAMTIIDKYAEHKEHPAWRRFLAENFPLD